MNITKKIYRAYSYEDARKMAEADGFRVMGNKTINWHRSGSPMSGPDWEEYVVTLFTNCNFLDMAGVGFIATITPGMKGRRKKPCTVDNFAIKGTRKFKRVYQIYDLETDEVLASLPTGNKRIAIKALKQQTVALEKDLALRSIKVTKQPIEAICYYLPGAKSVLGEYMFFGNPVILDAEQV